VRRVVSASGALTSEGKRRLARVEHLFGINAVRSATVATKEESDADA
jgi:hypothetical protein